MIDYSVLEKLEFQKVLNFIANYAVTENGKKYILNLQPLVDLNRIKSEGESVNEAKEILIRNIPPQIDFIPDLFETISQSRIDGAVLNSKKILEIKEKDKNRIAIVFGPEDTGSRRVSQRPHYQVEARRIRRKNGLTPGCAPNSSGRSRSYAQNPMIP